MVTILFLPERARQEGVSGGPVSSVVTAGIHGRRCVVSMYVMGEDRAAVGREGQMLGSYRLLQVLGTGGMGEVYLAEDTRLGRRIALKLLPPEFSEHPEKIERFETEARAIASLNHPGIVTLHSIEEAEGRRFLTMEHVEGVTLGSAIPPGGLAVKRLLPLAIALADAVSAAHRQGILHRDLKPDNVMLTPEGRLKVLDFGLAKLRASSSEEEDETTRETQSVTRDGRIVGTVAYMSPEQAQGLPVDHRSDVFSLGVLLYEMATGGRPFQGRTNMSVLSSILKDSPPPVHELRGDVPRPLSRLIQRALEKRPEDRYQSTIDLRRDLEDLKRDYDTGELLRESTSGSRRLPLLPQRRGFMLPAAAVVLVLLLVGLAWVRGRGGAGTADGRSSLAVFFFENLSGDAELDWLRAGLPDMLVTSLSQSPTLRVLSTSRLLQLLDEAGAGDAPGVSAATVSAIARRADVETALMGSFVRVGSQLRIQAQLHDPGTGEVLASEQVEGDAEEGLFGLVDELTRRIRSRLELRAIAEGSRHKLADVSTSSVEAYRDYVQGLQHHERLEEREARAFLEKAVAADPGFAMAHAKLSVVNANLGDMPKAREYAARALERADRLPPAERHYVEGRYYSLDPSTFNKAVAAYEAAVDSMPDLSAARNNLAQLLLQSGRYGEALAHLEELRRRGMTFPGTFTSLAEAYVVSGEPDRAEKVLAEYVDEHPDRAAGYDNLAMFLVTRGRYEDALRAYDRAGALDPRNFDADYGHFVVHTLQGRWLEAEANARRLSESPIAKERWKGFHALAVLALYDGDVAQARSIVDRALHVADTPDQRAHVRLFRAELAADLGEAREALAEVERALEEAPQDPGLVAGTHARRATCLAREGQPEDARRSRARVEEWLSSLPAPLAEPHRLQLEGELALAEGQPARARELLSRAAGLLPAGAIEPRGPATRIHYELGRAALAEGDVEAARRALQRVVDGGVERLWEPVLYVRSLALLAELEEKAGRVDRARELYGLYLDHWEDGTIDHAEVTAARQRLVALGGRRPSAA
jgi:serine/threonine protein kinase/tetratricopeptide (TPR) repeat protein